MIGNKLTYQELYRGILSLRKKSMARSDALKGHEVPQAYEQGYRTVCFELQKKGINLTKLIPTRCTFYVRELARHTAQGSEYDIQWDKGALKAIEDISRLLGIVE